MSAFSAEWLDLREPFDSAARSAALAGRLAQVTGGIAPLRVIDLGAGTGANLRYLAPRLSERQHWHLVDHDDTLLSALPQRLEQWARARGHLHVRGGDGASRLLAAGFRARIEPMSMNLGRQLSLEQLPDAEVVTASALLDLVSEAWLAAMLNQCRSRGAAVLFALTYDGEITCEPSDAFDSTVRALVNRHQRRDKGFGPALGPAALERTASLLGAMGYRVEEERSDWHIGPEAGALQRALIDGWAAAAIEVEPEQAESIERWRERRLERLHAGESRLRVGHRDVLGWFD
jgi:hypothetical protein